MKLITNFERVEAIRVGVPMPESDRGERLQVMLSEAELKALDDWRFARRMPSRASAVRELLKRGLSAAGFLEAEAGRPSQSFGVVQGEPGGRLSSG